jgi:16S rRNA (adenine1518-N6/adenine1519-N6)-dimethyltransferase
MTSHRARKRFGQHFLRDPGVIDAIVRAIAPTADDSIVEIGPGDAALTRPLARRVAVLHAIELDRDLASRLRRDFADQANVTIHQADALTFDYASLGDSLRLVGNLPYNISTPVLFALVGYREQVVDMHFMLQKEVVDRMAAQPGSKTYGRLGIMLGCHFEVEALFDVDRLAFDPPPEVTSSVVRLRPHPAGTFDIRNEALLSRLVAQAFSQRRKTIRNALRSMADEATLEAVGIDPGLRPEAIPIASYVRLANTLE